VQGVAQLVPIVVLLVLAYMLLVRIPRKRAREVAQLQAALSVGDQVMLTSGIFARVQAMADEKIDVEISPGVVVTVHQGAIGQIVRDPGDDATDAAEPYATDAAEPYATDAAEPQSIDAADPLSPHPSSADTDRTGSSVHGAQPDPASYPEAAGPGDGEPGRGAF
jgi:preprotein translocase subunit YajC